MAKKGRIEFTKRTEKMKWDSTIRPKVEKLFDDIQSKVADCPEEDDDYEFQVALNRRVGD